MRAVDRAFSAIEAFGAVVFVVYDLPALELIRNDELPVETQMFNLVMLANRGGPSVCVAERSPIVAAQGVSKGPSNVK